MTTTSIKEEAADSRPCGSLHPVQSTMRQYHYCDLLDGHEGDHKSIAPNVNFPSGFQVVGRWAS